MQWTDLRAEYSQLSETWTVMHPAFVFEFYGDGTKLVPYGEPIQERFLELAPKETEFYHIGNNAREYSRMDTRSLRRIKKTLAELNKRGRSYMIKNAPGFDVGDYSIEMHLGSRNSTVSDVVNIAFPIEFSDAKHISRTVEVFTGTVKEFPFWAAVAGYGFDLVWGREFEMVGMPAMMQSSLRFQGLLIRHRTQESYSPVKKLKSAGWLTFLDNELLELAGGLHFVRAAIDGQVALSTVRDGVLLKAGDRPPIGDVNKQDHDVLPLASVNRAISKIRIDSWVTHNLFKVSAETANRWLSRFD